MAGQARTVATPAGCQQRCRATAGCRFFNNFPNGGCHITTGASGTKSGGNNPTVRSGSVQCKVATDTVVAAASSCTAFQTGTFDPNIMLSLEFDRTLLNTTNANSLTDRFPRARELKLTSNRLQSFEPMVSQGVSRLESLTLEGNNLTLFTISVENFPSMRSLLLQKNELTVLPSELGGLAALTTLSVKNNRLAVLPSELGALTLLSSLNTYNNRLAVLPSELGKLTLLKYLWANNNVLTVLPSELGKLTRLYTLQVNNNVLTVLPSELGALTWLTDLRIQDNKLVAIPAELGSLTSLTLVNLERNRIQCKVGTLRCIIYPLLCYFLRFGSYCMFRLNAALKLTSVVLCLHLN